MCVRVSSHRLVSHSPDFDQQVRVRELVHRHGRTGGSVHVKVFSIHLVVATEIVHVDQVGGDLDNIFQAGAGGRKDVPDVVQHRPRLDTDIEPGGAHFIHLHPLKRVVRTTAACAGDKQEIPGSFDMRKFSSRAGLAGDDFTFDGWGGFFGHGWWHSHQR